MVSKFEVYGDPTSSIELAYCRKPVQRNNKDTLTTTIYVLKFLIYTRGQNLCNNVNKSRKPRQGGKTLIFLRNL